MIEITRKEYSKDIIFLEIASSYIDDDLHGGTTQNHASHIYEGTMRPLP